MGKAKASKKKPATKRGKAPLPGRPSSFKPEYVDQARKLCELGATDREVAEFFEVSERTVYRWQQQFPDFCQALKVGKDSADDRVEKSLYRRATGYSFDSEKITVDAKTGMTTRTGFVEHVPPDTTACIFWLKNRRKDHWRDKTEHEHHHFTSTEQVDAELTKTLSALSPELATAVLAALTPPPKPN